ncbi:MAG: translation initiation factor IF-3 [Hyphomonadaceae bacterium]|nr:translation initiation factor IF-3 [Clostridia bacterium]
MVDSTHIYTNIIRRCSVISKELMINEEIRDREIRVVDHDGSQLGIMTSNDALALALSKNMDLVKIAPQATPPVCKILDYGKYKFELAKKEKEAKKNQHVVNIKEVRFSPTIDEHDLMTKVNNAIKFLHAGDKVKVAVRFRGREIHHSSLGYQLLKRVVELVGDAGTVEKLPKLEGKNMAMFFAPKTIV